jgi:hypothetical protein
MAFDRDCYDTFTPNTFNDYDATTSSYNPEVSLSREQQSTWNEGNVSLEGYETNEPQDTGHAAIMGEHWSNAMPWAANWSFSPCSSHSIQPLHASALTAPDLSSRSTSRRSSLHPPFTPASAGRTPSPIQMKYMSSQHAVHVGNSFLPSGIPNRQQALSNPEQALMSLDFSPNAYSYYAFEASTIGGFRLNAIEELDREEHFHQAGQTMSHRTIHSSVRRSSLGKNRPGVWEMNDDRSWSQQKEAFTHNAKSATRAIPAGVHPESIQPTRDAHEDVGLGPGGLHTSVNCDQCGVKFTKNYRASNLGRHHRLKHAEEEPRKYVCQFCGKAFKRSDARLGHERKKHVLLL